VAEANSRVGILGATSLVGACLLPRLINAGWRVTAFSRRAVAGMEGVEWQKITPLAPSFSIRPAAVQQDVQAIMDKSLASPGGEEMIPFWICTAPIWVLPDHFPLLEVRGVQRVVVLSSTSRFTKKGSADPKERAVALQLADGEARVQAWAESRGVEWVILRPTMIYGAGQDRNISEIVRFIRRFGFFPLLGKANGLRQPVHVADVAKACHAALNIPCAANRAYDISGNETLSYREMVSRIFAALGRRPFFLTIPLWTFRLAIEILRCVPRYRKWTPSMAERMNRDLAFDHADAARDLDFKPRNFLLTAEDIRGSVLMAAHIADTA
jgi:uncharacterized protein YbjT (DUF2867 family)